MVMSSGAPNRCSGSIKIVCQVAQSYRASGTEVVFYLTHHAGGVRTQQGTQCNLDDLCLVKVPRFSCLKLHGCIWVNPKLQRKELGFPLSFMSICLGRHEWVGPEWHGPGKETFQTTPPKKDKRRNNPKGGLFSSW